MAIEKQKDVGSSKIGSAKRLAERADRLVPGKADGRPITAASLQKAWTKADEEQIRRLAEGVRLASAEGAPDVRQLSDEEFLRLLVR